MRAIRWVFASVLVVTLAACGGGNKSTTTTTGSTTTATSTAAVVEVGTSSNSLDSGVGNTVTVIATVKNAANNVMAGETVSFSADSGSLQIVSATTDASGQATAKLSAGGNKAQRSIAISARSGTVVGSGSVAVVGNTLAVTGSASLQRGQTATLAFAAKDSGGTPISGASAVVSSSLANGLSAASVTLDYAGTGSITYTATNAGTDTVQVKAAGVTQTFTVTVNNAADFVAVNPAANTLVPIGATQVLTFQYSGAPMANQAVSFATDRGTLTGASTQTASDGTASVSITAVNAGPATVTATLAALGRSVSLPLLFSATVPASVTVQASPTALAPNTSGSTQNQSTIEALVRDANNNPVASTNVSFAITNGIGGSLSAATAVTDADGRAKVQYIAGTSASAANGVTVRATAGGVNGSTNLTVSGSALFISIFHGVLMTAYDSQTYEVPFTLSVVDANGAAVARQSVDLAVWPVDYGKGVLTWDAAASVWARSLATSCANEDTNRNGQLDSGEDTNGNSKLDPGLPISLPLSQVTTDDAGFATFKIRYGKQFAQWLRATLTARVSVVGTESSSSYTDWLPVLVDDIGSQTVPPANVTSPLGVAAVCTNPN